jgi:predicted nucleotidyltransferase
VPRRERPETLDGIAAAFARACDQAGVRYVFVGGFAVLAWGQPRTTSDIDVLVQYGEADIPRVVEALEAQGLEVEAHDLRAARKDGSHVTVFTADPILTVDIKPALEDHEVDQISAGTDVVLERGPVRVAPAADTVAYKLVFGSPQDLQDARSIVARQGDRLDLERLWTLAERHGVLDEARELVRSVQAALDEEASGS